MKSHSHTWSRVELGELRVGPRGQNIRVNDSERERMGADARPHLDTELAGRVARQHELREPGAHGQRHHDNRGAQNGGGRDRPVDVHGAERASDDVGRVHAALVLQRVLVRASSVRARLLRTLRGARRAGRHTQADQRRGQLSAQVLHGLFGVGRRWRRAPVRLAPVRWLHGDLVDLGRRAHVCIRGRESRSTRAWSQTV